jgi:REP element-mobilizing transposase RayT
MPRKARIEFPGAVYHLLDRGDRREPIVRDDLDRSAFLKALGQVCGRTGWRVHAFVLMTNHYHLLIETPEANLVGGMRWFQTTYTVRFNRRHRVTGHLFQGRYKAIVVDPEVSGYFALLSDYIHLNPVRARMISLRDRLYDFAWSSYRWYAATTDRPEWFEPGRVLGELGLEDTASGRRRYAERMRARAVDELAQRNDAANESLQRGWCLGDAGFRERMLSLLERATQKLSGKKEVDAPVRRSHDDEEARRLIDAALRCFKLTKEDLPNLKRNDPRKLAMAGLIRRRTSVPNAWLARELSLGHASSLSRYSRAAGDGQTAVSRLIEGLEEATSR